MATYFMILGIPRVAKPPIPKVKTTELNIGVTKFIAVGFCWSALSSLSKMRAMTSSMTAAAMMSCPEGVCKDLPTFGRERGRGVQAVRKVHRKSEEGGLP